MISLFNLSAIHDLEESFSELGVEGGVDYRVEGTVYVTKPCGGTVQFRGNVTSLTVSIQNVCQEER